MYLSELKIWNFRKYSSATNGDPGLHIKFNKGLNLLVGENDSGKSAIIDAIKFVLQTQSHDYQRLEESDFYLRPGSDSVEEERAKSLKIECIFRGFDSANNESANFLEWLGIEKDGAGNDQYFLKATLSAERKEGRFFPDVKAGPDDEGIQLDGAARNLLRATYLRPLRDAESELIPGRRSRLAQILKSHEAFSSVPEAEHTITRIAKQANKSIEKYFEGKNESNEEIDDQSGKELLSDINAYLKEFFTEKEINKIARFALSGQNLSAILERLILDLAEENSGLGSYNRLYIAAELLLLKRVNYFGLKLSLIEEIEAHLHPQAQLRLIEYLQAEIAEKSGVQLIITSHSPNLASKVKLDNLIICRSDKVFPMGREFTYLEKGDYLFLERFLDVTKSNLFFAQGVVLVEGDAENILLPAIADLIGKPLTRYGISIVNVQGTAFLRYSKIFLRREGAQIGVRVAIVTDNDIVPGSRLTAKQIEAKRSEKELKYSAQGVRTFISPVWTLEYDILLSGLKKEFYSAILRAERIQNNERFELTREAIHELNLKTESDFARWSPEHTSDQEIAQSIFEDYINHKKISKTIIAQCFASLLKETEGIKERIESDDKFRYLLNAINYVTE